ncbi:MAG: PAS domain-containing protein [Pseudomonadota bacterium]
MAAHGLARGDSEGLASALSAALKPLEDGGALSDVSAELSGVEVSIEAGLVSLVAAAPVSLAPSRRLSVLAVADFGTPSPLERDAVAVADAAMAISGMRGAPAGDRAPGVENRSGGRAAQMNQSRIDGWSYLKIVEKVAGVGHWRLDVATNELVWSDQVFHIHGLTRAAYTPALETAVGFYHPDDRAGIAACVDRAMLNNEPYAFEARIIRSDGAMRYVHSRGQCHTDEYGAVSALFGVIQDVTAQKETETELRTVKSLYDAALEAGGVGVWDLDVTTGAMFLSPTFASLLGGADFDPAVGRDDFLQRVHAEDAARVRRALSGDAASLDAFQIEFRVHGRDGDLLWLQMNGELSCAGPDQSPRLSGSVINVSQRVGLEEELRRHRDELQLIFDNVPARIWYKDDANRILRLNAAAAEWMGAPAENCIGRSVQDLAPDVSNIQYQDDMRVIEMQAPRLGVVEQCARTRDGERWSCTDKIPHIDPVTGKRSLLVISTDVTEERRVQTELAASEKQLRLVLESTLDGYWDWWIPKDYEYMSPRFWKMFGIDPATKRHHPSEWQELIFEDDLKVALENLRKHVETRGEHPYVQEVRYRHADGSVVTVLCRGRVVEWGEGGEPLRMVGCHTDVSDLKRARDLLQQRTEWLERTNSELENFAYIVSHDLKTPLRGMNDLVKWIAEDLGDDVASHTEDKLDLIRDRVARMERLIVDVLDYARAGRRNAGRELVDTAALIVDVSRWIDAPRGFKIEAISPLPELVVSRTLLEQVFSNLLGNAVKHHDRAEGRVTVAYRAFGDWHEFIVTDDGPGVPADCQECVFGAFKVLQPRSSGGGNGIGLAIVKKMVQAADGEVELRSPVSGDRGTAFHVRFRAAAGAAPKAGDAGPKGRLAAS